MAAIMVAAGGVAYLLFMPRTSAIAAPLPLPQPSRATPQQSAPAAPSVGPNGPDPLPTVVARLRSSDNQPKQIFYVQAMMYSNYLDDAPPDGVDGQHTDAMISRATGGQSSTYGPAVPAAVRAFVASNSQGTRLLPFTLPQDVIDAVNSDASFVDSGAVPLQVMPTVPTITMPSGRAISGTRSMARPTARAVARPAGQVAARPSGQQPERPGQPMRPAQQAVIGYAGFNRPLTVLPTNAVGSNPGYGAMIDPRGLNIGLWNAIEGQYHAPIGTGIVAADNDQNPIAGQPGGYWSGYR